jgi:hypothetical protein
VKEEYRIVTCPVLIDQRVFDVAVQKTCCDTLTWLEVPMEQHLSGHRVANDIHHVVENSVHNGNFQLATAEWNLPHNCTVSTVGYGDYTPVTAGGRVVAVCIMLVGLTSVAVITAQIASSFMDQASSRREGETEDDAIAEPMRDVANSGELERDHGVIERLQAIEALLRSAEKS